MGRIELIGGVDDSANPTEQRPIVVSTDGHVLVDVAGVINVTVADVDQGDPNLIANAWPVKITDGSVVLGTVSNPIIVDTELPAAAALSDTMANPTAPSVGANIAGWDNTGGQWRRIRSLEPSDAISGTNQGLATLNFLHGFNTVTGWDRLRARGSNADAIPELTAGVLDVNAHTLSYNAATGQWGRVRGFSDNGDGGTAVGSNNLGTTSRLQGFNGSTYDRLRSHGNNADANVVQTAGVLDINAHLMGFNGTTWDRIVTATGKTLGISISDGDAESYAEVSSMGGDTIAVAQQGLYTAAFNHGFNGSTWDRLRSDITNGLDVDVTRVSGTLTTSGVVSVFGSVDTELPVAIALGDAMANPTAPSVGSHLLGWDAVSGEWERVQSLGGAPRFAIANSTNTVQATVATEGDGSSNNNQQLYVASYLRGFNGFSWDRLRSDTTNGLDVDVTRVSGTVTISGLIFGLSPGTEASNLGKAEDAPHTSGDVGVMALAVMSNGTNPVARAASNDYAPLSLDSDGRLFTLQQNEVLSGVVEIDASDDSPSVNNITKYSSLVAQIHGTYSGVNITFEASNDGGSSWEGLPGTRLDRSAVEMTTGSLTNTVRTWVFDLVTLTSFRWRATAWTSGTASIDYALTPSPSNLQKRTDASSSVVTNGPSSATSIVLLNADPARKGAAIYNDSTQTLYVKMGSTASITSYTLQILAGGYWEAPFNYTGRIDGIWSAADGNARITETF